MKKVCICMGILFLFVLVISGVSSADVTVIEGTVNDDYQVVTDDNQVYEIGFTEQSEKLAEEVNKKVRIKGEVETDEDNVKTINVVSYESLAATPTE